jgi:hypothetical protein
MNLYQPTITGSLSVSGSVNISGSITIAGGGTISGTASIATTALTASSADNLLVRNTLTAQTLVVQTITSSVLYSSGSNVFGNNVANTQTFTGSMLVTGSITANKVILSGGADQSELTNATNNDFKLTNSGNFRIVNNANTSALLTITNAGTSTFSSSVADYGLSIMNVQDSAQGLLVRASDNDTTLNILNLQSSVGATSQTWVDRFTVTKGGNVGVGTSSPISTLSVGVTSDTTSLGSTGLTIGGASTLTSGNVLMLNFTPIGASSNRARAGIGCLVGSDWGKGNLTFYTRDATNSSAMTTADERMRIDSNGVVTMPYQPSFYATSTAGETAYTANQVIVFNTARHNTGSHFNTSTGRFTAPVAGKYLFTFNCYAYGGFITGVVLTINGSQYTVTDVQPYANTSAANYSITIGFALVWELAAGDYVEPRSRGASQMYRAHSHFSGQLLS